MQKFEFLPSRNQIYFNSEHDATVCVLATLCVGESNLSLVRDYGMEARMGFSVRMECANFIEAKGNINFILHSMTEIVIFVE